MAPTTRCSPGEFHLLVTDRTTGSGYVYVNDTGSPVLVAATNRRTATDLTWAALASQPPEVPVEIGHVTAANQWAIDVGHGRASRAPPARYLALRNLQPPTPYLHHGSFL